MKQDFDLNIEGLEQVNNIIKNLPLEMKDKIIQDVNRQAAIIVKKEIENNIPDGDNNKPSSKKAESGVVIKQSSKTGFFIGFKKQNWYVKLIELGTKVRKVGKKKEGKYKSGNRGSISRQPFIQPAHDSAIPKVIEFLNKNYLAAIDKAVKKQLRKVNRKK